MTSPPQRSAAFPRPAATFFEEVGGHETFVRLVDRFYEGVRTDDVLAPMYPQQDWDGARWRLTAFLEQYWGGPTIYSEQRGHPRLRMRHAPFAVTPTARDRWLAHMRAALLSLDLAPLAEATLWDYLERAAHAMLNAPDDRHDHSPVDPTTPRRSLL
ncbi:globin [Miniimonas arenae]|uniref:Globin n=1 Tax=Miniimonas arenae TaxID=676201 RepID=A0A5C5BDC1_9MICO|nr:MULTISPECIES: globin [Miniimonas]TNU74091.1 globin [Miniimonas arenae]